MSSIPRPLTGHMRRIPAAPSRGPAPSGVALVGAALLLMVSSGASAAVQEPIDRAMIQRIEQEGLERSQALSLFHTLTDEIGGRLTGAPSYTQAAGWARDRFREWGLAESRLEAFDFGRGWSLEKFTIEMTAPRYLPLIAFPEAWTPTLPGVVSGRVVYVGDKTADEIEAMGSRLRGAIVLTHLPQDDFIEGDRPQPGLDDAPVQTGNPQRVAVRSTTPSRELASLLEAAGAAVVLRPNPYRDGTVGVLGNRNTSDEAVPSIVVAAEHYNMMARMAAQGLPVELRIELRTQYHEDDPRTFNVLAEIPGTDPELRDEIVLVGAHLDSWHSANGATDNGDGAVAVMEAMRILAAVGAQPRRTIRVALWAGEEQGLLGARAYVARHLTDTAARDLHSVYLNDDPGSGASLGFYMQGNVAAKAIFDAWLEPLAHLGVTRNIIEGIGSTDHVAFNDVGVPGFNVIKDFDAYDERTRHTNVDFPERMSEEELRQSAIVMATFAWHAAMRDERIPRATVSGG